MNGNGVIQLDNDDNDDNSLQGVNEERGGLLQLQKSESDNSLIAAQQAQQMLLENLVTDDWKIDVGALKLGRKIASGACGQVYKGLYYNTPVAIKELFSPRWDPLDIVCYIHMYKYPLSLSLSLSHSLCLTLSFSLSHRRYCLRYDIFHILF